jgi:predicted ATPase
MEAGRSLIRTPDQRLRVFVSSTLRELEPERHAVRSAVERLRLAPVMFELGARPHPPRALYRSYLAQSDIFVGIYWEKYGWVAPEEEVSGLEDEYRLSGHLPALIYIKQPAPEREPRLESLLDDIRSDDRTSYKSFSTPEELAELVLADLTTLLAERFVAAEGGHARDASAASMRPAPDIPAPYTELIGREAERAAVGSLLAQTDVRIVSLVGPGGVGKSRLAIEVAMDAAAAGRDVAFAALESVTSADRVITVIARALEVRDTGDAPLADKVVAAVGDRHILLVVDNMEHLLAAADVLVTLITAAPHLQLLVTSRSPLRLRAERVFTLEPLDVPDANAALGSAADASAVALFVARATAVDRTFRLTPDNVDVVVAICRILDGMPLAIELAAARMRILSPGQILERLDSALDLLVSGARDLPERQRAQTRTIQWSVDLLDDDGRLALAALSVFTGTFRLEAAEHLLAAVGIADPLGCIDGLIEASLIARADRAGAHRFRLFVLVRTYADGLLTSDARGQADRAWIRYYSDLSRRAAVGLRGPGQLDVLRMLESEVENVAGVERALLDRREWEAAAEYAWDLYLFLWIGGYLGTVRQWMAELLSTAEREHDELPGRTRAIALYYTSAVRFWQDVEFDATVGLRESGDLFEVSGDMFGAALAGVSLGLGLLARSGGADTRGATDALRTSLDAFRAIDDAWGQAMALVVLGRLAIAAGEIPSSLTQFEDSLRLATTQGELLGIVIAQNHRGWAKFLLGDPEGARTDFHQGLERSLDLGHDEGIAYGLEGFVGLAAAQGDARRAGLLLGASRMLRIRKGILNPGAFELHMLPLAALRERELGEELDTAVAEGEHLSVPEALEYLGA